MGCFRTIRFNEEKTINCFSLLILIVFGFLFLPSFFGGEEEPVLIENESEKTDNKNLEMIVVFS